MRSKGFTEPPTNSYHHEVYPAYNLKKFVHVTAIFTGLVGEVSVVRVH